MYVAETHSTNTLLREMIAAGTWPQDELFLRAGYQTAGRGQTGNGWESEADKNLLCSIPLPPSGNLFDLNMMVSVAVHRLVCCVYGLIADEEEVTIKWPNDIYVGDRKICGILIENILKGDGIKDCIIGIGLNVNQTRFVSDAPNPTSMTLESGREYDRRQVLDALLENFEALLTNWDADAIRTSYRRQLYRREGMHTYSDNDGLFSALLTDVEDDGHLLLTDSEGVQRRYAFKEVTFVI